MSSQQARHVDARHRQRDPGGAPGDRLDAVGALYDQHGPALFRLALTICLSVEPACSAVVQAFDAATSEVAPPQLGAAGRPTRHLLARLTYLACPPVRPAPAGATGQHATAETPGTPAVNSSIRTLDPLRRALLALTMYGDHTYQEAALLLRLDPDTARTTLRQMLVASAPTSPSQLPSGPVRRAAP